MMAKTGRTSKLLNLILLFFALKSDFSNWGTMAKPLQINAAVMTVDQLKSDFSNWSTMAKPLQINAAVMTVDQLKSDESDLVDMGAKRQRLIKHRLDLTKSNIDDKATDAAKVQSKYDSASSVFKPDFESVHVPIRSDAVASKLRKSTDEDFESDPESSQMKWDVDLDATADQLTPSILRQKGEYQRVDDVDLTQVSQYYTLLTRLA